MSNDRIIRCITSDGAVVISAAETSNIVFKASKLHRTSPVATAALGRLLNNGRTAQAEGRFHHPQS